MQETIYRMHLGPTLVNDAVKRLQDKGFVAFSGSEYTYVRVMEDEAISRHSIARAVDISGLRPWDIEVHNRQDVLTIGGFWIFAFDKKTGYEYGRVWADVNSIGEAIERACNYLCGIPGHACCRVLNTQQHWLASVI